jgi:hypothetical protein
MHESKLTVLHVCDGLGPEPSGSSAMRRFLATLVPRFDASRFKVTVVSLGRRDESANALDGLGIDVTYLRRSKLDPATVTALLKVMERTDAQVLHLHGRGASTFGRIAGAIRRIPTVLHAHGPADGSPGPVGRAVDWLLASSTDMALADSPALANVLVGARSVPAARVKVVGCEDDAGFLVPALERLYGILHRVSRPTRRRGVLGEDLSFLEEPRNP